MLRPPSSTLFPYTTLFRSRQSGAIETDSYAAMLDILQVLACQPVPAGPRLTVIGNAPALNRLAVENARSVGLEIVDVQDIAMLDAEHSVEDAIESVTQAIPMALQAGQTDAILVVVQPGMHQRDGDAARLAQAIHTASDNDPELGTATRTASGPERGG